MALVWFGGQIGWWWVTPLVGFGIGIVRRPPRLALAISLLVGGLGWGLPLALLALSVPVAKLASAVEGVVGLPATGGQLILLITVLLGCMLCMVGCWVGIAGMRLLLSNPFCQAQKREQPKEGKNSSLHEQLVSPSAQSGQVSGQKRDRAS